MLLGTRKTQRSLLWTGRSPRSSFSSRLWAASCLVRPAVSRLSLSVLSCCDLVGKVQGCQSAKKLLSADCVASWHLRKTCRTEQRTWLPRLRHRRHLRRSGGAEERHSQRYRLVRAQRAHAYECFGCVSGGVCYAQLHIFISNTLAFLMAMPLLGLVCVCRMNRSMLEQGSCAPAYFMSLCADVPTAGTS